MQRKELNQPSDGEGGVLQSLSIVAEFSKELSRGKKVDRLTRVLALLCEFLKAQHGLIAIRPEITGNPAILAFYSQKQPSGYQPEHLEDILQILIEHAPPLPASNVLWIRDLITEDKLPGLVSECDKVLSFSLMFETQDFGRVLIFLEANAKPSDEQLAVSEVLIDILSLYCSQRFSSVRDNYARIVSLRRITSLANSAYTLDETLRAVNREIKKTLECKACWAILPARNMIYGIVQINEIQNPIEWSFDQVGQEKIKSWIKKCASPLLLSSNEVKENLGEDMILPLSESEVSLIIPVRSRGAPLGLFSLVLPFDLDFKKIWPLIEEIEGPISAVISNAVLLEEVVQRASETAVLNEAAASLTTTFSINTILSITRRALRTLIKNVQIDFDLPKGRLIAKEIPVIPKYEGLSEEKKKSGILKEKNIFKIPILVQKEYLGLIILKKTGKGEITEQQMELAKHISYQLAPVLKSAYLFQSERTMREKLAKSNKRLEEVNKEIADLYSNLEKLYEQLGSKLVDLLEDQIEITLYTSQDCVHCAAAERVTQEALRLYKGQVSYRKVDVLAENPLWKGRKIKSVPAILIGDELLLGVPDPTRIHTCLFNVLLPLIRPAH
ncbi:MAG: hypothetical protein ACFFB3_12100 [Candidatus Hodarchaeota archaeon]